jgi:putative transposase
MHWKDRTQRRPVFNEPGHAHELTFTCLHRLRFLSVERTCLWFAEAINTSRSKLNFSVWAYVFMPDHAHLIVCPRQADYDISTILKTIKEPVGRRAIAYLREHAPEWLERTRVVRGRRTEYHFWQTGGGYDRNITEAKTLRLMIEYIHANPVRKGLAQRPSAWKWSSAGWFEGMEANPLRPDPVPVEWSEAVAGSAESG